MRGALLLLALSLKRARMLLLAMGLLLAAFQVLAVLMARAIHGAGEFDDLAALLPPMVRTLLGPAVASVLSFRGIVCLGYFDLGIIIALLALAIALATVPASEVETGFADVILARPLPRHWLITRTIALVLVATLVMLAFMVGGTYAGLVAHAPEDVEWPSATIIGSLALNLGLLMLCWAGIAMALGAACRRGAAGATTGLLALAALLLDYAGRLWPPADQLAWLSPFRYFIPFDLVMGTPLPVENILVLWAVAMSGFILAYYLFSQRDISR
jgi:ABC-2 type transport system permease protein